jgi:hypothetical protein
LKNEKSRKAGWMQLKEFALVWNFEGARGESGRANIRHGFPYENNFLACGSFLPFDEWRWDEWPGGYAYNADG